MVNYFFHCSFSSASSNAAGHVFLPLQMVKSMFHFFFQCSWSTTSFIAASQVLHLLQLVKYFFLLLGNYLFFADGQLLHCSWSCNSSIAAGQVSLTFQLVIYFFIAANQLFFPLQLVKYFFHYSWSRRYTIAAEQAPFPVHLVKYIAVGGQLILPAGQVLFYQSCSTTSSIAASQMVTYCSITAAQLFILLQLVNC